MIRIIVAGPRGHLAGLCAKAAFEAEDIALTAGTAPKGRDYVGCDVGDAAKLGVKTGAPVTDDLEAVIEDADIVLDCATRESAMASLDACVRHGKGFITGITGFSQEETASIREASASIPVLKAANTSYVTNVMYELLRTAAKTLGDRCQVEIVDYHAHSKLDAPSGTALEMGAILRDALPEDAEGPVFHSVRAGSTPSQHVVIFGAEGERLEISHTAYDWNCYALGLMDAVRFLAGKPAGLYTMEDVLGL